MSGDDKFDAMYGDNTNWLPHTCAVPPEIDVCAGCKQRADRGLMPLTQAARDALREVEAINTPPLYAPIWVQGTWLAACDSCGALVISQASAESVRVLAGVSSKEAHNRWHRKINELAVRVTGRVF